MPDRTAAARVTQMVTETIEEATGRRRRKDPARPRTGGPAGNARLTAWTGLVLLVLFLAELVTLLDVRGLISWHVAIGAVLIPPALLKTATTGWRIVRYYTGADDYRAAGPPPTPLRVLGPIVVISTLAVLGTGVALVLLGEQSSRQPIVTVVGQRVDAITLHQASFAGWAVATGLHTLGRAYPAVQIALTRSGRRSRLAGGQPRALALVLAALLAVGCAYLILRATGDWGQDPFGHQRLDHGARSAVGPGLARD